MRLFLDSSVLLAASGSATGASRMVVEESLQWGWTLLSSVYCLEETRANLSKLGEIAANDFACVVEPVVDFARTGLVIDRPLIYRVTKDRPVIATALALKCDGLLTLDGADFHKLLGRQVYELRIRTPGEWLREWLEQDSGR